MNEIGIVGLRHDEGLKLEQVRFSDAMDLIKLLMDLHYEYDPHNTGIVGVCKVVELIDHAHHRKCKKLEKET